MMIMWQTQSMLMWFGIFLRQFVLIYVLTGMGQLQMG